MTIERWHDGKAPVDEVEDFARRRRWFHAHALLLGASAALGLAAVLADDQRVAALAGSALALAAVAALVCGSTLVTFFRTWQDDQQWFDTRPVRGPQLVGVLVLLLLGVLVAVLGSAGRLDLAAAWLSGQSG